MTDRFCAMIGKKAVLVEGLNLVMKIAGTPGFSVAGKKANLSFRKTFQVSKT